METTITTILIALITTLGGSAAWRYYEKKLSFRLQSKRIDEMEEIMHITDLKKRIEKLELLLADAKVEKDDLRDEVVKLTAEHAALKTEVEYLMKENKLLRAHLIPETSKTRKKMK